MERWLHFELLSSLSQGNAELRRTISIQCGSEMGFVDVYICIYVTVLEGSEWFLCEEKKKKTIELATARIDL